MKQKKKQLIIKEAQIHERDTGSDQVQVALLAKRIEILSHHLKLNPKDIVCRRILLKTVSKWKAFKKRLTSSHQPEKKSPN